MEKHQCPNCGANPIEYLEYFSSAIIWKALPNGLASLSGHFDPGVSTHVEAICSKCGYLWKIDNIVEISGLQPREPFVDGIDDRVLHEMQYPD